ncbi:phosphonate metabolism transcriptional regulator PhnF [Celeribacter arenosi]|uniref:Phosphonate metabolism transcriptional regulator PhnF n=1 Tax=Celeribacter arenosi TaxID=792649 RepID=A0ABP7K6F3_9RHOB
MTRTPVWKSIAATLQSEIAAGHYRAGDRLATEAALATRFGVNRHTVRHAISDLVARGMVRTRRGSGAFVTAEPTEYPLGKRVRFHRAIAATGRVAAKQPLRIETRPCDAGEAEALRIPGGDPVVVYEGLSNSNGTPIAHFISVFPQARVGDLAQTLHNEHSVTQALAQNGIADYLRAETRLSAVAATPTQALHLGLKEGDPILRSLAINTTPDGIPVERGETYFAGDKVTLTVTGD